jgi:hypothetical protein
MVKGLRSPDTLQLDLMHTYNARESQPSAARWPSSMPFLFASLKVSIAISLAAPSSASCRRARLLVSAPACSPARTTDRTIRSGRRS